MFNTLSLFNGSVNVAAFPSSKGKKLDFIKSKLFLSSSAVKLMETCLEISEQFQTHFSGMIFSDIGV